MARGTDFGGVHSHTDLNLIQQKVEVQPAEPKTNFIDIPGADGSVDKTEQPGGRVTYKDRKITWTFALYPGENWGDKHRQVSNALNGKRCKITLDGDTDYYFEGRLVAKKYNYDRLLRQITVEAICNPYMFKQGATVKTRSVPARSADTWYQIALPNGRMPVVPAIEVTAAMELRWNNMVTTVQSGAFTSLDIELPPDNQQTLLVRAVSAAGTITVTYREGSL